MICLRRRVPRGLGPWEPGSGFRQIKRPEVLPPAFFRCGLCRVTLIPLLGMADGELPYLFGQAIRLVGQ